MTTTTKSTDTFDTRKQVKMKRNLILLFSILLLSHCGWSRQFTEKLKLVTTTSLIGNIVQQIGGDKVEVTTIVPGGMCPGHFDVRPGDIKLLSDAQIFLIHGWESFVEKLVNSVRSRKLLVKTINVQGNWMVPDIQLRAVDAITNILCKINPENAKYFRNQSNIYQKQILALKREIKQKAKNKRVNRISVVCSEMQAEFVKWLGFNVVATYGRPSDLTASKIKEVLDRARRENVKIVIDNLQSGPDAGIPIANEIGGVHVVLTNFPIDSYLQSLQDNASKLFEAVDKIPMSFKPAQLRNESILDSTLEKRNALYCRY